MSRRIPMLAVLALLAGCSPFQVRNDPAVAYSPRLSLQLPAEVPRVDWQLAIVKPAAENMLAGTRIAVRERGAELQVLAGARWSDTVPELLQALVVRAFEDSERILGVARQASGLRADFTLALDVRAFEAEYPDSGAPVAQVVFTAKLIGPAGSEVLAARTFAADAAAEGRQAPAVVAAFERALERSLTELVAWTLQQGQAATEAAKNP